MNNGLFRCGFANHGDLGGSVKADQLRLKIRKKLILSIFQLIRPFAELPWMVKAIVERTPSPPQNTQAAIGKILD